jgi:hypothetical protein
LDLHLRSCIAKEQTDALDNLHNSVDLVGAGNGHILYRRRSDSHSVGGRGGSNDIPPDSGAQDSWLVRTRTGAGRRAVACTNAGCV